MVHRRRRLAGNGPTEPPMDVVLDARTVQCQGGAIPARIAGNYRYQSGGGWRQCTLDEESVPQFRHEQQLRDDEGYEDPTSLLCYQGVSCYV